MSIIYYKYEELLQYFIVQQCVLYHHFSVFYVHVQTQVAVTKNQIQTILPHILTQRNHQTKQQV